MSTSSLLGRLVGWGSARPTLVAGVLYAVLAVLFVGPGLIPGQTLSNSDFLYSEVPWTQLKPSGVKPFGANFEQADAAVQHQPFWRYTRSRLPDVPLWNPHVQGGRTFLGNAQSAVFSPFLAPIHLLPGFWGSLAIAAAIKLFVGAFGMFLFARVLGLRFGGALLSGVVYAFGTYYMVWLAWPLTNLYPLIPLILLACELIVRRPGVLPVAGLAALVALQFFGGHPESSFHVMVVATVFVAFRTLQAWWRGPRERALLLRPGLAFVVACLIGTALAAVALVPFVEALLLSGDLEYRATLGPSSSDAKYLFALFLNDYWGRPTQTVIVPFISNRGWYAGGLTLMLVAAALIVRPTATRLAALGFMALTILMVVGDNPVFRVVTALPLFDSAHNGRMVIFVLMSLALLAGCGLDDLTRSRGAPRRARLVLGASAGLFAFPFAFMALRGTLDLGQFGEGLRIAWGFQDPSPSAPGAAVGFDGPLAGAIRMNALLQWTVLAGLGLCLVGLRAFPRPSLYTGAFVALAVSLVAADLFRANMGYNPGIDVADAAPPATGAIRYLQARAPARFVGTSSASGLPALEANLAMDWGLYDARGYDFPIERRWDRLWREEISPIKGNETQTTTRVNTDTRAMRALSLLGVADVIQDTSEPPLRVPGLRLAYSGPDARVYANARAVPRAMLVGRQTVVPDEDAAYAAVIAGGFQPRRTVVTERRLRGIPDEDADAGPVGRARLVSYGDEEVTAEAIVRRPGVLVLNDVHFPGWKARLDGRETPLRRVDYLLRGVVVPAGEHTVELRYEPASWRIGWIVSLAAALVLVAVVLIAARIRIPPIRARRGAPA